MLSLSPYHPGHLTAYKAPICVAAFKVHQLNWPFDVACVQNQDEAQVLYSIPV
jgi:hypothetical protein